MKTTATKLKALACSVATAENEEALQALEVKLHKLMHPALDAGIPMSEIGAVQGLIMRRIMAVRAARYMQAR